MPDDTYLLCGEDAAGAFFEAVAVEPPGSPEYAVAGVFGDEDDSSEESIAEFIGGEAEYSPRSDYPDRLRSRSIDRAARAESVAWIIKVQEYYAFLPLTAYLAVNYMDRFLSLHRLPWQQGNGWAMQLLAVTCLSLAAKMEETLVPSLLDLQIEGTRYIFESRTIRRMELLVLTALNWRLRSVTPFTFIDFFAYKVDPCGKYTRYLISRATQIILSAIYDIEFLDHCPSSMAAAVVLCATSETPSLAFMNPGTAVGWSMGLAEEGISSCYQLMQQLAISNVQRKQPVILSQLRVTTTANLDLCSQDVSSSSSSPPPSKRRKRD